MLTIDLTHVAYSTQIERIVFISSDTTQTNPLDVDVDIAENMPILSTTA